MNNNDKPSHQVYFDRRLRDIEAANRRLRATIDSLRGTIDSLRMSNAALSQEIEALESTNQQLTDKIGELQKANQELAATLEQYASSTASRKPRFSLNYSSERNNLDSSSSVKQGGGQCSSQCSTERCRAGRKPHSEKSFRVHQVISYYPDGISHKKCRLHHHQFVWRLIEGQARYIHYKIYAVPGSDEVPAIPGVRNRHCEYGIEFLLLLAHHVYWLGLSFDKACELIHFYTGVRITKSQADSLLYQLSHDWEREYEELADFIAMASILYIDETGWKLGTKSCYTWVFDTLTEVYYCCGVGRGKNVLESILGDHFNGIGVTDNYGVYTSIFTQHQLCWAHFLRKAAELMLRNPTNSSYRRFYANLLSLYHLAKRYQNDPSLSAERAAKVLELQKKIVKLCKRSQEEIVTEQHAEKNGWDKSQVTSESEAKLIRLQKELVEHLDCLFVFVEHPEVESTNNRSERNLRPEALARKTSQTSKSERGAKRRGIIVSVLATIKRRANDFSLKTILEYVKKAYQKGTSIFNILKPPDIKSPQTQ
jgi:hypothetical protein